MKRIFLALSCILLMYCFGCEENMKKPREFSPTDVVPEKVISKYGIDDFFYVQEISDELFNFMYGKSYKEDCTIPRSELRYIRVLHKNLKGESIVGEMVLNQSIADVVLGIFYELYKSSYPIEKMHLVDYYDANDELSMRDNNSSSFNFRFISHTTKVSKHGKGEAVDINPLYNPYHKFTADGTEIIEPSTAVAYLNRDADFPYKIVKGDLCYKLFTEKGFTWGGDWTDRKDYQHFEK